MLVTGGPGVRGGGGIPQRILVSARPLSVDADGDWLIAAGDAGDVNSARPDQEFGLRNGRSERI